MCAITEKRTLRIQNYTLRYIYVYSIYIKLEFQRITKIYTVEHIQNAQT